ncbi:uncharacterized protein LOC124278317 isoform X4 [Haliotis rubra]|uniref:uncharacterized protein LOC124278317 isoform X4 n=1 Tax=Haliotis rubra TaxID=36100 RepID=UPI001EE6312B|nr:uncharacterized protein LOC124278317 isoform X4 [Haliotis rubra]
MVATQASAVRGKVVRETFGDTCVDKVDCPEYASSVCKDYADWAKYNCPAFCGICKPQNTTAPPPCEDVEPNCPEYGLDKCIEFPDWAHGNCRKYCGFCPQCVDKLDTCHVYGEASCFAPFLAWAAENCRRYCDLCTTTAQTTQAPSQSSCVDKLSNCKSYGSYVCTGQYETWARDNCAMTCNYCVPGECLYKGQSYGQGKARLGATAVTTNVPA